MDKIAGLESEIKRWANHPRKVAHLEAELRLAAKEPNLKVKCDSKQDGVQCTLWKGHKGQHQKGHKRWAGVPMPAQPDSEQANDPVAHEIIDVDALEKEYYQLQRRLEQLMNMNITGFSEPMTRKWEQEGYDVERRMKEIQNQIISEEDEPGDEIKVAKRALLMSRRAQILHRIERQPQLAIQLEEVNRQLAKLNKVAGEDPGHIYMSQDHEDGTTSYHIIMCDNHRRCVKCNPRHPNFKKELAEFRRPTPPPPKKEKPIPPPEPSDYW